MLDLTDLLAESVDPDAFFRENFMTNGMKTLLQKAFERLHGNSEQGMFGISQCLEAMKLLRHNLFAILASTVIGGGKTHCLFALGLLAKHPEAPGK